MFDKFPKTRPPLPKEIEEIYSAAFKLNLEAATPASSVSKKMEGWLHKQVAKDLVGEDVKKTTLEVGAGTLTQFPYEPEVGPYDIVEPFEYLYAGRTKLLTRVRNIYSDICEVPDDARYDRITSIAVFEHVCDLPQVVAKCGLLLKPGGMLRVGIPSEGTFLWGLGWRLTTGLEFRIKHGLDYGLFMKHNHVNTAKEVRETLEYCFSDVRGKSYGLCKALSIYQFYVCENPNLKKCREIIS